MPKKESKKNVNVTELQRKIITMNLTDMKAYVKGNIKNLEVSSEGLHEVMKKLTTQDTHQKYYINADDMDTKKKKAFDLVLAILQSKKLTFDIIKDVELFQIVYKDILHSYDKEHAQIYTLRLEKATGVALENLQKLTEMKKKMELLGY